MQPDLYVSMFARWSIVQWRSEPARAPLSKHSVPYHCFISAFPRAQMKSWQSLMSRLWWHRPKAIVQRHIAALLSIGQQGTREHTSTWCGCYQSTSLHLLSLASANRDSWIGLLSRGRERRKSLGRRIPSHCSPWCSWRGPRASRSVPSSTSLKGHQDAAGEACACRNRPVSGPSHLEHLWTARSHSWRCDMQGVLEVFDSQLAGKSVVVCLSKAANLSEAAGYYEVLFGDAEHEWSGMFREQSHRSATHVSWCLRASARFTSREAGGKAKWEDFLKSESSRSVSPLRRSKVAGAVCMVVVCVCVCMCVWA